MIINDRIYKQIKIDEPVILELIQCPAMQRLKKIQQQGYFEPFFPNSTFQRFEHSVGVYYLLKMFGASIEEQIAGLIHDVSHAAFSHCVDYALASGSEKEHNHQDNIHEEYVRKSEIAAILERYGYNLASILNDRNFPLKEKNLPDLCADRLDYSLRTALSWDGGSDDLIEKFLENLKVKNGSWFFSDYETAFAFAEMFRHLNNLYYAGLPSAIMHRSVGDYLRRAIKKRYITEGDLYKTDQEVLDLIKIYHDSDAELKKYFLRMNNKVKIKNDSENYDVIVYNKSRIVDPFYIESGEIRKVSDKNPVWKEIVKSEVEPKKYFLKFYD